MRIENVDALQIICQHDTPDTLFYCDPPYVSSTRTGGKYDYDYTDADHRALASTLHTLKGMVMLSGYPSPLYTELYGDWHCVTRQSLTRFMRQRTECLWLSPNTVAALPKQMTFEFFDATTTDTNSV